MRTVILIALVIYLCLEHTVVFNFVSSNFHQLSANLTEWLVKHTPSQ